MCTAVNMDVYWNEDGCVLQLIWMCIAMNMDVFQGITLGIHRVRLTGRYQQAFLEHMLANPWDGANLILR